MMIEINGKEYELKFGIEAIEVLDNQFEKVKNEPVELGSGIMNVYVGMQTGNVDTLITLIHVGTLATKPVSKKEITKDLDKVGDYDEFVKIADEVFTAFKKTPAVMYQANHLGLNKTTEEVTA